MSFGVPFGGLQEMLRHLFEVAACDEGKLLARLRNMQREGFPPGINVGRGIKVAYSLEQLAAILFLHMLVDAGFPPDFAIRLFNARRKEILGTAVQDEGVLDAGYTWPGPRTKLIVIRGSVLSPSADMRSNNDGRSLAASLSTQTLLGVQEELVQLLEGRSGVHLFDFARLLGRGITHLVSRQVTTIEEARSAFTELRSSL